MYSLRERDLSYFIDGDEASAAAKGPSWKDTTRQTRSPRSVTPASACSPPSTSGQTARSPRVKGRHSAVLSPTARKLAQAGACYGRNHGLTLVDACSSPPLAPPWGFPVLPHQASEPAVTRPSSAPSAVFSPRSSAITPRMASPSAAEAQPLFPKNEGLAQAEKTELISLRAENRDLKKQVKELKAQNQELKDKFDHRGADMAKLHERLRKFEKSLASQAPAREQSVGGPAGLLKCQQPCCIPLARLEKAGLNLEPLSELDAKWAGSVFSLLSVQVKASGSTLGEVFRKHKDAHGRMDEAAFRSFIRHFIPSLPEDRLTRLFYFADTDGSGFINFLEFLRLFGIDMDGRMGEEYFEHVMIRMHRAVTKHGGLVNVLGLNDRFLNSSVGRHKMTETMAPLAPSLTRGEVSEMIQRFISSVSGQINLREFNDAMQLCASSAFVTEEWVQRLFKQISTTLQKTPKSLKEQLSSLGPEVQENGWIGREDLRTFLRQFQANLRDGQIDRVFGFLCASCTSGSMGRFPVNHFLQAVCRPTLGPPQSSVANEQSSLPSEVTSRLALQLIKTCGSLPSAFQMLNPCLCFEEFCVALESLGFGSAVDFERLFTSLDLHRNGRVPRAVFLTVLERHVRQLTNGSETEDASSPFYLSLTGGMAKKNPSDLEGRDCMLSETDSRVQYFREAIQARRAAGRERSVPLAEHEEMFQHLQRVANRLLVLETELEFRRRQEEQRDEVRLRRGLVDQLRELELAHSRLTFQLREQLQNKAAAASPWEENGALAGHEAALKQAFTEGANSAKVEIEVLQKELELARTEKASTQQHLMGQILELQEQVGDIGDNAVSSASRLEQLTSTPSKIGGAIGGGRYKDAQKSLLQIWQQDQKQEADEILRLRLALRAFGKGDRDTSAFVSKTRGILIAGRFAVRHMLSVESDSVVLVCSDSFKRRDVTVKLPIVDGMNARNDFLRECCIYTILSDVAEIQDVIHFPGLTEGLAYCVMELLAGRLLASHLDEIRSGHENSLPAHEAAELCDALLHGLESCHSRGVTHLDLKPSVIWEVAQPAQVVVKILDFGQARLSKESMLPPEARHIFRLSAGTDACEKSGPKLELDAFSPSHSAAGAPDPCDGINVWCAFAPYSSILGVGSAWYMSPARWCGFAALWQREATPQPTLDLCHLPAGCNLWVEKEKDKAIAGLRQVSRVSQAVQGAVTAPRYPEGMFFEVQVHKIWPTSMLTADVETSSGAIGLALGFTRLPPKDTTGLPARNDRAKDWPLSWVVGYDGRFYQHGEEVLHPRADAPQFAIPEFRRRQKAKLNQRSTGMVQQEEDMEWPVGPLGWSFAELLRDDSVGLLAEDTGFLTVYVNGRIVSRLYAEGIADYGPLFPLVELCGLAREVGLPIQPSGPGGQEEQDERMCAKNKQVELVESLAPRDTVPYADVYAAAVVAMELFQSTHKPEVSPTLAKLLMATQMWLHQGRPAVAEHNGMLTALSDWAAAAVGQTAVSGQHLSPEIKHVLDRVFANGSGLDHFGDRFKIKTALEFRTALNQRTACSHVSPEFLRSHVAQVLSGSLRLKRLRNQFHKMDQDNTTQEAETESGACWDLTHWTLSSSHVRRVIVVLQSSDSNHIGSVSIGRLEPNVPDDLQLCLAECFQGPTSFGHGNAKSAAQGRILPRLFFYEAQLPADTCPVQLARLAEANAAGLLLRFVRRMDLTQGRSPSIGNEQVLSGPAAARVVGAALRGNGALEELKASRQDFGDEGAEVIGKALTQDCRLLRLELAQSLITDAGIAPLAQALMDRATQLKHLELGSNALGCSGCNCLAEMIKQNQTLVYLGLQKNKIGAGGATKLGEALSSNCTLEDLDLGRNSVGADGASILLAATRSNSVLRKLNLQDNELDVIAATKIAEEISAGHRRDAFETVTFHRQNSGRRSSLKDAIVGARLRVLNLRHNPVGSLGAAALLSAVQSERTGISELNLAWCELGMEAALAIAYMLGSHSSANITKLDLRDNRGLGLGGGLPRALNKLVPSSQVTEGSSGQASGRATHGSKRRTHKKDEGDDYDMHGTEGKPGTDAARYVQWLNLANIDLDGEGAGLIASSMPAFLNLEELFLYNNVMLGYSAAAAARTAEALKEKENEETWQEGGSAAEKHRPDQARFDSWHPGLPSLVEALPAKLKKLSLGSCALGPVLVPKVLKSLASRAALEDLSLSDNDLGMGLSDGGNGMLGSVGEVLRRALCNFIQTAPALRKFDLALNQLGDQCALDIVVVLCSEAPKVEVDFCANQVTAGFKRVIQELYNEADAGSTMPAVDGLSQKSKTVTELQESLAGAQHALGQRLRIK
eukprot:TRINITY_DN23909_c0_g2_i1.p1 TRINITY_DN23909_c0_g2~~TRINITY_DN23909_c0_g2_i1.p1  ORF type:complete len:2328 (-),score=377.32 TRINITY_DN23909_c0_g2_i1:221-7204(-)